MDSVIITCALALVVLYAAGAHRLTSGVLTAPLLFMVFGILFGDRGLGWIPLGPLEPYLTPLAEVTLIIVLFGDASRLDLSALRAGAALPIRLLLIGLPLTIALGAAVAALLFGELSLWEAAALGAVLAPTDAALGQAVVTSEAVPLRIRQALNVESGLNDGIALPVVLIFTALAVAESRSPAAAWLGFWAMQVTLGPLFGALLGWAGGRLLGWARSRELTDETHVRIGGLALALLAYFGAEELGGNGFMSAFIAGLAFGRAARGIVDEIYGFLEAESQLLMMLVFVAAGALLVPEALERLTPTVALYVLLSLTVVRMVPTALALLGSGARRWTVVFLGWFGPRGLATLLFGAVIVEANAIPHRTFLYDVAILTVLASVLAHGLTASAAARWYGAWMKQQDDALAPARSRTR